MNLEKGVTTCESGYEGSLCHGCGVVDNHPYARNSAHTCSKCGDKTWNIVRLILVTVMILIYVVVLVIINVKS